MSLEAPAVAGTLLVPAIVQAVGKSPLIELELDGAGEPIASTAFARIERTPAEVWAVISDVDRYGRYIPMIHRITRTGDRVRVELRFKVAVYSAKFTSEGRISEERERWLDIAYISGEPHGMAIRFELAPAGDGRATMLATYVRFDPYSLGWLVKFFLKHHPEIRFGVVSGTALTLLDAIRRAL
jgi:carbon monoxide dehydrogenase subunit G